MKEFITLLVYAGFAIYFYLKFKQSRYEADEEAAEYDYLTVREQIAQAKAMSDALGDMEQLQTDIAASNDDCMIVIHLAWIGIDNQEHEYDLYCDGMDIASENMAEIAAAEAHCLRQDLQTQCRQLAERTSGEGDFLQNYDMP